MSLKISDEILEATGMSEEELREEIAILLFQKEKLTLGQAAQLAGVNQLCFQHLLASREIQLHYDISDFEEDVETLKDLGRFQVKSDNS